MRIHTQLRITRLPSSRPPNTHIRRHRHRRALCKQIPPHSPSSISCTCTISPSTPCTLDAMLAVSSCRLCFRSKFGSESLERSDRIAVCQTHVCVFRLRPHQGGLGCAGGSYGYLELDDVRLWVSGGGKAGDDNDDNKGSWPADVFLDKTSHAIIHTPIQTRQTPTPKPPKTTATTASRPQPLGRNHLPHVVNMTICGTGLYRHHRLHRSLLILKRRVHGLLIGVVFEERRQVYCETVTAGGLNGW